MQAEAESPLISVVVATFNASATLQDLFDSLFRQDAEAWELIVIDGGSPDATVEVIRRNEARIAYWHSKPDRGIYDAWNQGIARARGRYICFMGADDAFASPGSLRALLDATGGQEYDLVSSQGLVFSDPKSPASRFGSAWDYSRVGRRMVVCHPGLLHRRGLFSEFGNFDETFRIAGDLEFLLRLPASIRTCHVPVDTVLIQGGGISRRNVMARLREQRLAIAACPRFGPVRAWLVWLDKVWRYPLARLFGIPH